MPPSGLSKSSDSTVSSEHGSSSSGRDAPNRQFFIPDHRTSSEGNSEAGHDPFATPGNSVPSTPAPSSVVSFSGGAYFAEQALHRRQDSHMSVQSGLRQTTSYIQERPAGSETRVDRTTSSPRTGPRSSFMPPRPLRSSIRADLSKDTPRNSAPLRAKRLMRSSMLTGTIEKPWLSEKDRRATLSYWIVYLVSFLGIVAVAIRIYFAYKQTLLLGNVCLVMEDNFDTFDTENTWMHEVSMSGFGNAEFEMTTDSANNSFVRDGHLYLVPTLTSDVIGYNNLFNGYTYNLTGCTDTNVTACGAVSNETLGTVIPPVMSARIHTREPYSIKYGRVEISAKLPRGDWLWPALWMLPVSDTYGPWPRSGEIDIMEARGNSPEYQAQGIDYVRGSLNWGPFTWLNGVSKTYGWWTNRRKTYADGFHTYALEWSPEFIRIYADSRLTYMLTLKFDEPFFKRGQFPAVVANGSQFVETPNPWAAASTPNVAPFDQPFYLIMNVAVGGTNGWFPDGVGNKPWLDGSLTAMREFAKAQDKWYSTWPKNVEDRALVIDWVKMWKLC